MKVLVCGDRNWDDKTTIRLRLCALDLDTLIIHGAQGKRRRRADGTLYWIGADTQADEVAKELGMKTDPHPAGWNLYGPAAGPKRNQEMLNLKPDLVIAFHSDLSKSRGTLHCTSRARSMGIPVEVISGRSF